MAVVEGIQGKPSATINVDGLEPNTEYYLTQDDLIVSTVATDSAGKTSFVYKTKPRRILKLKHKKNTIVINADGSVTPDKALTISGNVYFFPGDIQDLIEIRKYSVILDGNGYSLIDPGEGWSGIRVTGWGYVTIRNVNIKGFTYGISGYEPNYLVVENSTIVAKAVGLALIGGESITVRNNVFKGHSAAHVLMWGGVNNSYSNNYLGPPASTATTVGFLCYQAGIDTRNVVFERNTIDSAYIGFMLYGGRDYVIKGNKYTVDSIGCPYPPMWGRQTFMVLRDYYPYPGPAVTVTSNSVNGYRDQTACGVFPRGYISIGSPDNVIEGNTFNLTETGIMTSAGGNDTISSNYFYSETGIYANSPSQKIVNNTAFENVSWGIYADRGNNQISSNTITNTFSCGIGARSNGNIISSNNITGSVFAAISIGGGGNTIYHNDFVNNTAHVRVEDYWPHSTNVWNLPYPAGGNYYSGYSGADDYFGAAQNQEGTDRVADTKQVFDAVNIDSYPFTLPGRWKESDRMPPGKAWNVNLEVDLGLKTSSITVHWTNTYDDFGTTISTTGFADVRLSTFPITGNADFDSLALSITTPTFLNGLGDITQFSNVSFNTLYFAGVRLHDDADNIAYVGVSPVSAGIFVSSPSDGLVSIISPVPVQISTALPAEQATLIRISTETLGLVPGSLVYKIEPSGIGFTPPARITFIFDPAVVTDIATLAIYKSTAPDVVPGSSTVYNQKIDLLANTITGDIDSASYFVLLYKPKITDLLPPRTSLLVGEPKYAPDTSLFISSETLLGFLAVDDKLESGDGAGVGVSETHFAVDSDTFSIFASPFNITGEGVHIVKFFSVDRAGNAEAVKTRDIAVDNTPPLTQLTVNGSIVSGDSITVPLAGEIGFISQDPVSAGIASGRKHTMFSVDSLPFSVFIGTFTLAAATHTVVFFSVDNVDNAEAPRLVQIEVSPEIGVSLDINPDTLNLKSQGQYITAYFEVRGATLTAADIEDSSLRITEANGQAPAVPIAAVQEPAGKSGKIKFGTIGDYDLDGIPDLMVKFDRQLVIDVLPVGEQVGIKIEGNFKDGAVFEAEDFIRTILPGSVAAGAGGGVTHNSLARVDIPPNALPLDTGITIVKLTKTPKSDEDKRKKSSAAGGFTEVGAPFEFGPEGTVFNAAVTLTLPYDVTPGGAGEVDLRIACWNPLRETWEPLVSITDWNNKTVSAKTSHFSVYQILSEAKPQITLPETKGYAYIFPNPAKRGANPTVHIEAGFADSIDINIYDIAGGLVKSHSFSGPPALMDDGSGRGPQYAYEWTWDASGAGSGVYLCAITAKRTGQKDFKTVKKIGVIK